MELVWHMHHCGDSVSEGGSQAAGGKRREIVKAHWREDKRRRKKKGEGGCITEIRSAPFSETS